MQVVQSPEIHRPWQCWIKKYKGHRTLPDSIMEDLGDADIQILITHTYILELDRIHAVWLSLITSYHTLVSVSHSKVTPWSQKSHIM